jgi:hypothetical protein
MRIRAVLTAMAVIAAFGATGVASSNIASADAPCPAVQVLGVPGTFYYHTPGPTPWQPNLNPAQPGAMITDVADLLGPDRATGQISYEQVNHPADIGAAISYRASNAAAVTILTTRISQLAASCPGTRFAIIGYSNGAGVAGDVLHSIGQGKGPIPADRVATGILFADPRRDAAHDQLVGPPVRGTGVDLPRPGGFGAVRDRTYQFCAAGDLVCDNDPDATLLRPLMLRFAPTANVTFVAAVLKAVQQNGLDAQKWAKYVGVQDPLSLITKVATTVQQVEAYNRLGTHGYYNRLDLNIGGRTATQWAADKIRDPAGVTLPVSHRQPDPANQSLAPVDPAVQGAIAGFGQFQQAVKTLTGGATLHQILDRTAPAAPREKLTSLLTKAILERDPSATPAVISKAIAALADVGDIVLAVDPAQLSRLATGASQVAAAVAQLSTGVVTPDAVLRTVCGTGQVAAASLAIIADVLRMYEKSADLPQIADLLDLVDPTSADGARIFAALPPEARTPAVKATMISLARIGKVLNSIDKQRVISLARQYAEMAAGCNISALAGLPALIVQTIAVGADVIRALATLRGQGQAITAAARKGTTTEVNTKQTTTPEPHATKAQAIAKGKVATKVRSAGSRMVTLGGGSGIVFGHKGPVSKTQGESCTLTTIGYDKAGELVGLTNAHCFYDNDGHQWLGDKVYFDASKPGTSTSQSSVQDPDLHTGVIGTVAYISGGNPVAPGPNGPGLDYAVIKLDKTKVKPTATVGSVTIARIGAPPRAGTVMCKRGRTSGLTCGAKLLDVGDYFTHTIWAGPGDSGSPVAVGQTLVGNQWVTGGSVSMVAIINDLAHRGDIGAGFTPVAPSGKRAVR